MEGVGRVSGVQGELESGGGFIGDLYDLTKEMSVVIIY